MSKLGSVTTLFSSVMTLPSSVMTLPSSVMTLPSGWWLRDHGSLYWGLSQVVVSVCLNGAQ